MTHPPKYAVNLSALILIALFLGISAVAVGITLAWILARWLA